MYIRPINSPYPLGRGLGRGYAPPQVCRPLANRPLRPDTNRPVGVGEGRRPDTNMPVETGRAAGPIPTSQWGWEGRRPDTNRPVREGEGRRPDTNKPVGVGEGRRPDTNKPVGMGRAEGPIPTSQ